MAHKSIVDRVLMLAAAVCAAALAWQLTVLLTSKRNAPSSRMAAVATAPVLPNTSSQTPGSAPDPATSSPVRIVYPGADTSVKTSVKAGDALTPAPLATTPPPVPASPASVPSVAPAPARPAAPIEAMTSPRGPSAEMPEGTGPDGQAASAGLAYAPNSPDQSESDQTGQTTAAAPSAEMATAEPPPTATGTATVPDGAVDLNHASIEALNHLRGAGRIGQAIVSHRPYRSVEDLVRKRVLRRNVFEQIKQQVVTQ